LNWIGFIFTFVISLAWGYSGYQSEDFASTEPFLILFFLFYVFTSILYAHKQPVELKGVVDGSLVFGVPTVFFTTQAMLVYDFEYGMAFSSIGLGLFYILLARALWNRQVSGMRLLTECFLSLGVIFASLSIPYILEGRWIAAAWALEGAGMIWIGFRQSRILPRVFGTLLQAVAGVAFIMVANADSGPVIFLNNSYIGSLIMALAGLSSAWLVHRYSDKLEGQEINLEVPFLAWGLIWWWLGGFYEIGQHSQISYVVGNSLLFLTFGALVFTYLARLLDWSNVSLSLLVVPMTLVLAASLQLITGYHPFENFGIIAWGLAFATFYRLLYLFANQWPERILEVIHPGAFWLVLAISTWGVSSSLYVLSIATWTTMLWGVLPALAVYFLPRITRYVHWPFSAYENLYQQQTTILIVFYIYAWVIYRCGLIGDPSPLLYIPILNPQDLVQLCIIGVLIDWALRLKKLQQFKHNDWVVKQATVAIAALAFVWLNSLIAHVIHFYLDVSYALMSMFNSPVFQTSLSITWTVVALLGMSFAKRTVKRNVWIVSATLLGVTVVKLILIDLGDVGTIARIVSFITVGGLMLVIGYLAPIPPNVSDTIGAKESSSTEHGEATT